jgi:hypothetical protein
VTAAAPAAIWTRRVEMRFTGGRSCVGRGARWSEGDCVFITVKNLLRQEGGCSGV